MDPKQISSLAKLLRDNGDKILNANFKLTLSGSLLRSLNDSFTLIVDQNEAYAPNSFQVVKPNNSKSEVFRDLQFIHDFVQKIQTLLIAQSSIEDQFEGRVDLSKFRSLRRLEVQRLYINQVTGIQQMRAHLQEIVCTRSIDSVKDIISHCGGDKSNGFVWNELKTADFSYNSLMTIDCSLEFAPWLQHLNLSHNQIVSVDAIKWLPNLKHLNLSFNRLSHIPMFNIDASKRLKTLLLSNNYIEDVGEVSRLDSLNELDISENCLLDHSILLPLSTLISLTYLSLEGNPLSCHPKHRQATSRYLHKNTSTVKFILDAEPLSKYEKSLTGTYQSYHMILTSRVTMGTFDRRSTGARSSGQPTPTRWTKDNTPASSLSSINSINLDSTKAIDSITDEMSTSIVTQKRVKARKAIISDTHEENQQLVPNTSLKLEGNKDHLETKRQIEDLRKQYGDDWLLNHGEKIVSAEEGRVDEKRLDREKIKLFLENVSAEAPKTVNSQVNNSTNVEPTSNELMEEPKSMTKKVDCLDSGVESSAEKEVKEEEQKLQTGTEVQVELDDIYTKSFMSEEVSDAEENEVTFIVHTEPNDEEMFLIVSDESIREKNIFSGRTKTKWSLKSLESCDQIRNDVLRLNFDTIKKDKKERIYKIETGYCHRLEQFLRQILAKRPLSEMNLTLYRCANCITQFSRDNIYKSQNIDIFCPECNSTYIIEIKESPRAQSVEKQHQITIQSMVPVAAMDKKKPLEKCESFSSTGSAASLNESSSCSKISKSDDSFDSNQSIAGSSNCDRDADFTNGESDIEILSNPSQSSIEVLDSFHSGRKHSSEERRISQAPSLDTIADNSYNSPVNGAPSSTLINQQTSTRDLFVASTTSSDCVGGEPITQALVKENLVDNEKKIVFSGAQLTESSSSGSVTDSICTTYEQNRQVSDTIKPTTTTLAENKQIPTTKQEKSPEKINKNESSMISSMLGGLFQSTNNLMSRSQKTDQQVAVEERCDEFKYSYTDFDNVDHRLKLFFYQTIFEDDNEHFKWLVKGKILNGNPSDDKSGIIDGIFIMSTTKFYILQIFGKEREDISKWVKRLCSGTIDRVEIVRVLPWKIGITFTIKGIGHVFLFLQDIPRTDSLLLYFANNPLPDYCTLEYKISERFSQKLLKTTDNAHVKMLAILNHCEITIDNNSGSDREEYPTFIITESNLYLTVATNRWINDACDDGNGAELYRSQPMSNLIEVEKLDDTSIRINFQDEILDKCELWTCTFETISNAASTLNAIGQSWEKLFGVPLGIN